MIRTIGAAMLVAVVALSAAMLEGQDESQPAPASEPAAGPDMSPDMSPTEAALTAAAMAMFQTPDARASTTSRTERRTAEAFSPELIEQCLEVAAEVDPELAANLREIRRKSPGPAFERAIRNARHLVGLVRLKERDPQLYEIKVTLLQLDAQIEVLAGELDMSRAVPSGATAELEDQLRNLVRQQVGLSIAARGMYLRRLRENMKSLQDQLAQDSANFERTVEQRMRALAGLSAP